MNSIYAKLLTLWLSSLAPKVISVQWILYTHETPKHKKSRICLYLPLLRPSEWSDQPGALWVRELNLKLVLVSPIAEQYYYSHSPRITSKSLELVNNKIKRCPSQLFRMFLIVTLAYLVCWSPYHLDALLVATGVLDPMNVGWLRYFRVLSNLALAANSCLNPLLYCFLSEHFRYTGFLFSFICHPILL